MTEQDCAIPLASPGPCGGGGGGGGGHRTTSRRTADVPDPGR